MGIVRRHATINLIINYIGAAIGAINFVVLLPKFFPTEYIGIIRLIFSIANILQFFAAFGFIGTFVKFFPKYKDNLQKHIFFVRYIFKKLFIGIFITTIIYVLAKPLFIKFYIEKSPLYLEFYYYVIPIFWALLINLFVASVLPLLYKTVISNFIKEILSRLFLTFSLILHLYFGFSVDEAVKFYLGFYIIVILLMVPQFFTGKLKLHLFGSSSPIGKEERKEWIKYALFGFLSGSTFIMLSNIDSIMVGSMIDLKVLGVYSVYIYMTTMLIIPSRALQRIAKTPLVEAISKKDNFTIFRLYERTSLIQSSIAAFLIILIILNKEIFFFVVKKEEFIKYFNIFIILAIGAWIDLTGGVNYLILSLSDYYRYDLYVNLLVVIVNIIFNYIFITTLGGIGAAIATTLSYFISNFVKSYILYKKMKLQPFSYKHLQIIFITTISYFVGVMFPNLSNMWINSIYKSILVSIVFIGILLWLKTVKDYNDFMKLIFTKIREFFSK